MLNPMPKEALPRLDNLALLHVVEQSQALLAAVNAPLRNQRETIVVSNRLSLLTLSLVHELALRAGEAL